MPKPNTITFGGVRLNNSEIAQKSIKTLKNKYGKTEKYFVVRFKNGVEAAYRGGDTSNASISSSRNATTKWCNTDIYGVTGLELKGNSNAKDFINIEGGTIKYVDVMDNGSDEVTVLRSKSDSIRYDNLQYEYCGNALNGKALGSGTIWTDRQDSVKINSDSSSVSIYDVHRINK